MPHPDGGHGNYFNPQHDFNQAYQYVGNGVEFTSTTGEIIFATQGHTRNGNPTIVFRGERVKHGNVCHACWGYRSNCSNTRIGQCTETLDAVIQI
jgi:hypothetical protein